MLLQPAPFNPVLTASVWPTNNACAEENDNFDLFAVDCHFPVYGQQQQGRSASADDAVAKAGSCCSASVPASLDTPLSKSLENIIMDDLFKSTVSQPAGPVTCASQVYGRCPVESSASSSTTSRYGYRLSAARARVADRDRDLEQLIDRMLEVQSIPPVGDYASAQSATSSSSAQSSVAGGFSLNATTTNLSIASPLSPSATVSRAQLVDYKPPQTMQHLGLHNVKSEPLSGMPMSLSIGASPTTISDFFSSMAGASAAAAGAHGYASPMHLFAGGFDLQRPPTFAAQPDMMRAYSNPDTTPQFMPPPGASSTQYLSHAHSIPAHLDPPHGIYQQVPPPHLGHMGIPRRGSHGATSSSSTSSHTGTPSPLQNQPLSPTFGTQSMRFSAFADSTVAYSQTPTPTAAAQPLGLADHQDLDADKLCAVCSDRAVCQHYGARTCEGCKGFFKRTVQKKAQYVCAGNKNCPIDKRYRSRCQYCRYQKCLAVGMVKEVVRYGSLQGRRGRLPSKTKCQQSDEPPSPPVPLVTSLARAYTETRPATDGTQNYLSSVSRQQLVNMVDTAYVVLMRFIAKIPGTQEMPAIDLRALLNRNFFPLLALRLAYRSMESEDELTFETGETIDVHTVPEEWRRLLTAIRIEANGFKHVLDWDASSFACLLSLVLLHYPENSLSLNDNAAVDRLESTIVNALKDHCSAPSHPHPSGLAKVMAQIAKFQQFNQIGVETLADCTQTGALLTENLQGIMHMFQL